MEHGVQEICEQVAEVGDLLTELLASVRTADGPDLAIDPRTRTDDRLRALVVGLEQIRNATDAAQAVALAAMGREARAQDAAERVVDRRPTRSHEEFVADEVSALLSCTKMAANVRYGTACQAEWFPVVARAWRAGLLDARKVATICEQASLLEGDEALRLAATAVDYATEPSRSRTAPQLREWLRRRVIAADPDAAQERRQRALGDRRVVITPGDDGVSELWALLPAVEARQIQQVLTETAEQLGGGDPRTMDQRRADALVDLLLGQGAPASVQVQVIVPGDTLTGAGTGPATVPGLGPITRGELFELLATAGRTTWCRVPVDVNTAALSGGPETGYRPSAALDRAVRARDVTCRFPGCRRSADSSGTDLDHTVPWPTGQTSLSNLAVLCRRHHRLKHQAGWHVTLAPDGTMTWTTPSGRTLTTRAWQYTDPPPT
jgi:hypothetical protein